MRSGFVSLIGRTNAGKSSLLNYLLGQKLSMVSHKVNATRRKINGIVMHNDNQIIFVDTPGLHESKKMLNQAMIEIALKSISDCDLVVFLATVHDSLENYKAFLSSNPYVNHILVITKTDEVSQKEIVNKILQYQQFQDKFKALIPMSIKKNVYKKGLLDEICKYIPEHEYFYDPEYISSTNVKDIYRDFILEAIFENVSSEVPYCTDVLIEKVIEKDDLISVYAKVITDTESHKKMLIGKEAQTIKRIGIKSKKLISTFSETKIFIKLDVFVKKNWKTDEKNLKMFI